MRAITINGEIKIYHQLPNIWNNILNFNLSDKITLEANGFFDVIIPEIDNDLQYLGDIYFDNVNLVFTYPVLNKILPSLSEAKLLKINEIKEAVKSLYNSIQWYLELCRNDGIAIPTDLKVKIRAIRTRYEAAKSQIESYTDVSAVLKWKVPYDQIEALRMDLESIS